MRSIPNIDKNIHRAAADHSFFAGFIRGEREVMQRRLSRSHCFARFGPHFRFDAAAADGACGLAILEEEHLGAASLRRRTARVGNGGDDDPLAAPVRFANQTIEIVLSDGAHVRWSARILLERTHPACGTPASLPAQRGYSLPAHAGTTPRTADRDVGAPLRTRRRLRARIWL